MTTNSIRYRSGYKHVLAEAAQIDTGIIGYEAELRDTADPAFLSGAAPFIIRLERDGRLTLANGYAWNGANVIRDRPTNMLASGAHDALCQLVRNGLLPESLRPAIDEAFARLYVSPGGGWRWVAKIDLRGLRWFSLGAYKPSAERVVYSAP